MKRIILITICCLGTIIITTGQEQQAQKLLSKAIYEEEVNGNLDEAIKSYQVVLDQYPDYRKVSAEALFHLGMCYEKQGIREAVNTYQRLVSNYPDQKNLVDQAKNRLNRLVALAEEKLKAPLTPKFTKIEIPTNPGNGVLSPDGKKLAYISEKSLWVVPVHGKTNPDIAGEPVKLTENINLWELANMSVTWSVNSKWLAFYATEKGNDIIYKVSANGGNPEKMPIDQSRSNIGGYDYRMSLSSDGKFLAYVNCDKNNLPFINIIQSDAGSPRKLTESGYREPSFSPDGRFVATVKINNKNKLGDKIYVIPVKGGKPILISDDAEVVKSPVWSPDGSMIAFLARNYEKGWANSSNELWIAAIDKNGKPKGLIAETDLHNSTTSMLAGWSAENKIGIWLSKPAKNLLYTVPAKGGEAMQVTSKNSWMPCWSPDGKYLYFYGINTNNFAGVESVPSGGGEVSRIAINSKETVQPEMPIGGISVSPDGKKLVFAAYYNEFTNSTKQKKPKGFHHIVTIPVNGGRPVELTTNSLLDGYPVWSPYGTHIAFLRQEDNNDPKINLYKISADGSNLTKVTSLNDSVALGRIDWSPDGKWIGFFSSDNTIKMIPAEGGISKIVVQNVKIHSHFGLSFSSEGDKIAYTNLGKLYVVDINSGSKEEVRTGIDAIPTMPSCSPDGGKIAFSAYDKGETDLWLMEDFLPLEKLAQKKEKEKESFVIRKVIDGTNAEFEAGKPSPDGKYFIFTDWDTGNLAIYNATTQKKRFLTKEGSWEKDHIRYVENSTWSPDGKQIVYDWQNESGAIELHLVGIDGSNSRILYKNEEWIWVQTFDWSSDGKQILACFQRKDGTRQIVLVNAENGTERVIKTLEGEKWPAWPGNICFSPDGKYIVYDFPPEKYSQDRDIYLMSVYGDYEIPLIKHPGFDRLLGWAPDGKNILFTSDRTGTYDAFAVQVTDGKPLGEPKLIKSDIGNINPMGFTRDGSFYYNSVQGGNNICSVDFDPEEGKITDQPKKLIKRFEGSNGYPSYSPDGKYLAYASLRKNQGIICIHNCETGKDKDFYLNPFNINRVRSFKWSPDGSSILAMGRNNNFKYGAFRINVQTGNVTPVIPWENWKSDFLHSGELSNDGKTFYYVDSNTTNGSSQNILSTIIVRDIETGAERKLYQFDNYVNISLSPDGKWLASSHPWSLKLMPASGGEPKEIYRFGEEFKNERPVTWSANGKYILFSEKKSGQNSWELCRISAQGGESEKFGLEMKKGFNSLSAHPNGRNIAFSSQEQKNVEFWKMENFLPKEETVTSQK